MLVNVLHHKTGENLLKETAWQGETPRVGDVLELHCGHKQRWKVEEVDWVFEDVAESKHDDVPLRSLNVRVMPFDDATGKEFDPVCVCGHAESIHSPNGCTGRSHTCECQKFTPKS